MRGDRVEDLWFKSLVFQGFEVRRFEDFGVWGLGLRMGMVQGWVWSKPHFKRASVYVGVWELSANLGRGAGRGGIPCPLPSRPPHLRQPFQLTPTPSPAPCQETFQNDKNWSQNPGPMGWGLGPQALGPAPGSWAQTLARALEVVRCSPGDFEKRHLPRLVAPIDFRSPGHPKRSAGRPA